MSMVVYVVALYKSMANGPNYTKGEFYMARGGKNNIPDAEVDAVAHAALTLGDVLSGGTIILTILILGGGYFVCSPGITDPTMCVQVTRLGLTGFFAHALGFLGVSVVVARQIWRRNGQNRASTISLQQPEE